MSEAEFKLYLQVIQVKPLFLASMGQPFEASGWITSRDLRAVLRNAGS